MCHVKRRRVEIEWTLLVLMCLMPPASFTSSDLEGNGATLLPRLVTRHLQWPKPTRKPRPYCDLVIESRNRGPKNGTFQSPNWPSNYDDGLRCVYKFVALPTERVSIRFTFFDVKGVPPRCIHDYVDMYTQVRSPDQDLLDVPLHGRYCGPDMELLPHLLISMGNVFILGFYTDRTKTEKGFQGEYRFIDASVYTVGTPAPPNLCGQTVKSEQRPRGILLSPTYPGMYPDNIFCFYKLQGQAGQRIRFNFIDLDLYSGGEHCPFDYVKIYDGYTNQAEVIGIYCGRHKNLELFSTTESLHIEFVTKSGRVEPTKKPYVPYWEIEEDSKILMKGFKADFEISSGFVNLDFITEGHHVRGTECDQRVLSTGESNGTITSPGYPDRYPLNVTCRYYVDGLVDRQNLEKARLTFEYFDLPIIKERCDNGYLHAYLQGQDITSKGPDRIFCGKLTPSMLVTTDPRLLLVFDTHGSCTGRGFKAHYQFVTDYAIPGTPATDAKCHFIYNSASRKAHTFNSPRHPSNYPHNTICTYEFHGLKREQVRITFDNFKVENRFENCSTDYVDVYSIATLHGVTNETLIGHFCGKKVPGPLVSEEDSHTIKIVFHTDSIEFNSGFRAKYEFIEKKPFSKRCFMNVTRGGGGLIHSPNHPHKYLINTTCEWHIYSTSPYGRILLQFVSFAMEGSLQQSGCANAVLKIYTNNSGIPSYELCGLSSKTKQVVSTGGYMKMRFISSAGAVGAKGFRITWTEILPAPSGSCGGFKCKVTGYCIATSLKCNHLPNCGEGDTSDEDEKCGPSYSDHGVLHVILGVVITLVLLVFILVCVLHRRRKARKKKHKQEIEVRYVTRGAAIARDREPLDGGPRTDQLLLKERTEKVSIV